MSFKQRLPNLLTNSRIVVIPLLLAGFYLPAPERYWVPAAIFLYACVTDFFDGYLARVWQASTTFGRVLDPIADKLLVVVALFMLAQDGRADILPAVAILCREILVSGLREFLIELRVSMPVTHLAKYKTSLQMVALFLLLIGPGLPEWSYASQVGRGLLWLAAVLTLVTGYVYLQTGLRHMEKDA
ncbi:MAG: CDP-diacylglycerol--glycerol-3-phosphate 3-phosphatidyltransferase [Rickettsiales bacterium]|nr:CDP-diacylglycerol--glycerol-3-phosphate 3-phosphatidyltransferase [Rickettsiales bacterium]